MGADAPTDLGAQRIVGAWVDAYTANGIRPTGDVKGQAAKSIGALLKAGNDPGRVFAAAVQAGTKGYPDVAREIGPMNGKASEPQRRLAPNGFPADSQWARATLVTPPPPDDEGAPA